MGRCRVGQLDVAALDDPSEQEFHAALRGRHQRLDQENAHFVVGHPQVEHHAAALGIHFPGHAGELAADVLVPDHGFQRFAQRGRGVGGNADRPVRGQVHARAHLQAQCGVAGNAQRIADDGHLIGQRQVFVELEQLLRRHLGARQQRRDGLDVELQLARQQARVGGGKQQG